MLFVWKDIVENQIIYRAYRRFYGDYILERVETYNQLKMRIDEAIQNFDKVVVGPPPFLGRTQ